MREYSVILNSTHKIQRIKNRTGVYSELVKLNVKFKSINNNINDFSQLNYNHFDKLTNINEKKESEYPSLEDEHTVGKSNTN